MQLIDSKETYVYVTSKYLVWKKEEIKCNNMNKMTQKWLKSISKHQKLLYQQDIYLEVVIRIWNI